MKIFDITVAISDDVPVYEGDPPAAIESVLRLAAGDAANVSQIRCGVHTATHVDAPSHFIGGGRRVDQLDLKKMTGACRVVEINESVSAIEPHHIPPLGGCRRVLFKTRNSAFWSEPQNGFRRDFTFLTPVAASLLAGRGIDLVGIDYLSVEEFGSTDFATHKILLEREIVIVEGLDLRGILPGDYEIICLPMKYVGGEGDGAPARTILRTLS